MMTSTYAYWANVRCPGCGGVAVRVFTIDGDEVQTRSPEENLEVSRRLGIDDANSVLMIGPFGAWCRDASHVVDVPPWRLARARQAWDGRSVVNVQGVMRS